MVVHNPRETRCKKGPVALACHRSHAEPEPTIDMGFQGPPGTGGTCVPPVPCESLFRLMLVSLQINLLSTMVRSPEYVQMNN